MLGNFLGHDVFCHTEVVYGFSWRSIACGRDFLHNPTQGLDLRISHQFLLCRNPPFLEIANPPPPLKQEWYIPYELRWESKFEEH